jgi:hypothetical protein
MIRLRLMGPPKEVATLAACVGYSSRSWRNLPTTQTGALQAWCGGTSASA